MRKRRKISARFLWLFLAILLILFFLNFFFMPMFPRRWSLYVFGIVLVVLVGTFYLTKKTKPSNRFTKVVNGFFCLILIILNLLLPYYKEKVSSLFQQVMSDSVKINVYMLKDDVAKQLGVKHSLMEKDKMRQLANGQFATVSFLDEGQANYGVEQLKKEVKADIVVQDAESLMDAVELLYSGQVDGMVLSEVFVPIIEENEAYAQFTDQTYVKASYYQTIQKKKTDMKANALVSEPFSIFFGGNDEEGKLSLVGRTDVDMIVNVNPKTGQIAIVNLPRDSYIDNPAYGKKDKLTHLGLKGLDNTLKGISNYLDQPIKHYVLVNFTTFMKIIDALGGVDIENPYAFTALDGQYFEQGPLHMNSIQALMYVRERYSLKNGDFDRNMHQQLVMQAIIQKLSSKSIVTNFNRLLSAMKDAFLTDVESDALYALCRKQLEENIDWNIVKYHVEGTVDLDYCASAPGQKLSIVRPYENQVEFIRQVIDDVYQGKVLEQQELPSGK